jgi:hypothetical protein
MFELLNLERGLLGDLVPVGVDLKRVLLGDLEPMGVRFLTNPYNKSI